jgi:hypothetical protein
MPVGTAIWFALVRAGSLTLFYEFIEKKEAIPKLRQPLF